MKKLYLTFVSCLMATASIAQTTTAYGYQYQSRDNRQGWVSFDMSHPQTINFDKKVYGDIHPSAAEYVDGKIYTFRTEFGDFTAIYSDSYAVYDAATFEVVKETPRYYEPRVVDMTYDYTTNTMYALVEDTYSEGILNTTSLAVVDLDNGSLRIIGNPGELHAIDGYNRDAIDQLVTIAADPQGQLYAMSAYRYLYKIDKHTGVAHDPSERHNLATAEQFQSMAFTADGHLWWSQQHPSYSHFCEIDLATGIPGGFVNWQTDYDLLNKLGDDIQLTGLFFKDRQIVSTSPKAVDGLTATVSDADPNTATLSWVLPTTDYNGAAVSLTGIKIYRIGTSEPIATLAADATTFTDNKAPNGLTTYQITPFNETCDGFPAFVEVFTGTDRLCAVSNIVIALTGNTVDLTWSKPTKTVNGGYADYDAITYNIYRVKGDTRQQVAAGIGQTQYTETIADNGSFYYIIEPICAGVIGETAQSDAITVSSKATVPYFTSFEDDQDGTEWIIKNCTEDSYGWAVDAGAYYIYEGAKCAYAYSGGSSRAGNDWIFSPEIEMPAGEYTVTFYGNGSSFDTHTAAIYVGTDPDDISTFDKILWSVKNEYVIDKSNTEHNGYKKYEFPMVIESAGDYRLGIHFQTTSTYAKFRVDNLSITPKGASGIVAPETPDDQPIQYYNLQGIRVDNPSNGMFILRQGNKTSKVILR